MAQRYSAPASCRELVTPVRQAKGAKPVRKTIGNRCLPPPAPISIFPPGSRHFKRSRTSPAKSKLPIWQASSRPNPAFKKKQKNTLFRSDTTDPYFHVDRAFAFRQHTPKGVSPLSRVSVAADRILAPRAQTGLRLCGSHRSVFLIIVNVPYANHRLSPSHRHGKETATYPAAHPRRSATLCGVKCVN